LANAPVWRWLNRIGRAAVLLLAVASVVVVIWARRVTAADPAAAAALEGDDAVIVQRDEWVVFQPRDFDPAAGLIFYPGAKADPVAYAPVLSRIAAEGYVVVMTPMPLNLAMLAPDRAARVIAHYPAIRQWVMAGHDLGGMVACSFAKRHREQLAGLILWASFPTLFDDLSAASLPTLAVSATLDREATPADISQARELLPADTTYLSITGGDHWNFGDFSTEHATAVISRLDQQAQIVKATVAFLARVAPVPPRPAAI
jgi:hypothetical protein